MCNKFNEHCSFIFVVHVYCSHLLECSTYRIYPQIGRTCVLAAPQTFNGFHGKKKIVEVKYRVVVCVVS